MRWVVQRRGRKENGVSWDSEELGDPPFNLPEGASRPWLSRLSRSTLQWHRALSGEPHPLVQWILPVVKELD